MLVRSVLLAGLVGYVALAVRDLINRLAYEKHLTFNDGGCKLLTIDTPVEDLSLLGDGHCAFGGGGDLWNTFMKGSSNAREGGVWLINATSGDVHSIPIHYGSHPTPSKHVLHGIHYNTVSKQLYAINHDESGGESVEVFAVSGDAPTLRLDHIASVHSELFGNMALNDVVEGVDGNEFYVSEWQPYPFPTGGKKALSVPPAVKVGRVLTTVYTFFQIAKTRVFRCTLQEGGGGGGGGSCTVASTERYVGANGLAISDDRSKVYVNDPGAQRISVLARVSDPNVGDVGSLVPVGSITPVHIVDNIEMTAGGVLSAGTIPLPYACSTVCEDAPYLGKDTVVEGRPVGCGRSPGTTLLIKLDVDGIQAVEQVDILTHDGSLLSDVSSGLVIGKHVLLGSPHSNGVLHCSL